MTTSICPPRSVFPAICALAAVALFAACKEKPAAPQSECAVDPAAKAITDAKSAGCLIIIDGGVLVTRVGGGGATGRGKVTPPGGSVSSGETARCAAVRQTLEETGLKVKAGEIFAVWKNDFHLFHCTLADPRDIDKARSKAVPSEGIQEATEKLLIDLPSMRSRGKNGKRELWAFPENVVISAQYKKIPGLSGGATATDAK